MSAPPPPNPLAGMLAAMGRGGGGGGQGGNPMAGLMQQMGPMMAAMGRGGGGGQGGNPMAGLMQQMGPMMAAMGRGGGGGQGGNPMAALSQMMAGGGDDDPMANILGNVLKNMGPMISQLKKAQSASGNPTRAPVQAAQGPMPAESPALPASMATAIGAVYGALLQLLMPPAPPLCSKAAVELAKEVALGLAVAHKSVEEMAQALVAGPLSSFTGSDLAKRVEAVSAAAQAVVAGQDAFAEWMGARAAASAQQPSATALYRLVTEQEWLAVAAQTAGISVSAGPVSAAADKTDSDDDDEFHDAKDYEDEAQAAVVQAVAADGFGGSALDHADGFIHLSTASQAQTTADLYFKGKADTVLLTIDTTVLAPGSIADDGTKLGLHWEMVTTRGGERLPHYFPSTQDAKPNLPLAAVTNAVHLPLDRSTGSPRLPQLAEPMTWKRPPPPPQIVAEHHYSAAQWPDAVTASAAERALWRAVVDADSKCISPPAPCSAAYKAGGTTTKGASASGARSGARGKSKRRSALDTLVHDPDTMLPKPGTKEAEKLRNAVAEKNSAPASTSSTMGAWSAKSWEKDRRKAAATGAEPMDYEAQVAARAAAAKAERTAKRKTRKAKSMPPVDHGAID